MAAKIFTVVEANGILPTVSQHLTQLQALQEHARTKYEEMERIKSVGYRKDGNLIMLADYRLTQKELDDVVTEANRMIAKVSELGCELKDIENGLVDFPAVLEQNDVMLCWKLGEPHIAYYHTFEDGYAGRRPLQMENEESMGD